MWACSVKECEFTLRSYQKILMTRNGFPLIAHEVQAIILPRVGEPGCTPIGEWGCGTHPVNHFACTSSPSSQLQLQQNTYFDFVDRIARQVQISALHCGYQFSRKVRPHGFCRSLSTYFLKIMNLSIFATTQFTDNEKGALGSSSSARRMAGNLGQ